MLYCFGWELPEEPQNERKTLTIEKSDCVFFSGKCGQFFLSLKGDKSHNPKYK
jgi:hypothetical protein